MKISVILPHYKTLKITTVAIHKLIEFRGNHNLEIFVVDNNASDGTGDALRKIFPSVNFIDYPKDKLQSHGVAISYAVPEISNEIFVTAESDSFPTSTDFFDSIEKMVNDGYDSGGSLLSLSGGQYLHPAGAFYKKSLILEAEAYCNEIEYAYIPHISVKEGFPCHVMVHNSIVETFYETPTKFIKLEEKNKNINPEELKIIANNYKSVVCPFHNGMGDSDESYNTYGLRSVQTEPVRILNKNEKLIINRLGFEPGQWLCYFQLAMGRKLKYVETHTAWMPGRVNEQQDFTLMQTGFTHLWGCSSFHESDSVEFKDVVIRKKNKIEALYNSLPENEKIP